MKIIQSFWTGGNSLQNPIMLQNGWLSPEYHWFSWALSCLQLRKYYKDVELVTDKIGKHILVDLLKLPYSAVHVELDCLNIYPSKLWALAKIYTYSLQKQPFIHVDSDIYIWAPFDQNLIEAELIAQNFEIDFPFYQYPLRIIKENLQSVPECIKKEFDASNNIRSCNTGIIGGYNLNLFQEYKNSAFNLIDSNLKILEKIELDHFNICFEQFLYYALSKQYEIPIKYFINVEIEFNPTYPGFANFNSVPYKTQFIHAMANYKKQNIICWHLANRLRKDYPEYYYSILSICQQNINVSASSIYNLPNLNPTTHTYSHFLKLKQAYLDNQIINYPDKPNWSYFYAKSMSTYDLAEQLFSLQNIDLYNQTIVFDSECTVIKDLKTDIIQTIQVMDSYLVSVKNIELDDLNMLLIDSVLESTTIGHVIETVSLYLSEYDRNNEFALFQQLVIDRIKELFYDGVLIWIK